MATPRVAVVTGANKGIGLAIVRALALTYPTSYLARSSTHLKPPPLSQPSFRSSSIPPAPLLIYLTSRDPSRGQSALNHLLTTDEKLRASKVLKQDGGMIELRYRQLDVGERESVDEFVEWIGDEHGVEGREGGSGLTALINNAGVWEGDEIDPTTTSTTLTTNYHAPLSLSLRLLPLLRLSSTSTHNPRIINISSLTSKLRAPKFNPSIIHAFRAAIANRSIPDITALMDGFEETVGLACEDAEGGAVNGKGMNERIKAEIARQGWPPSPYAVSKAGLTAVSMILGREELRVSSSSLASPSSAKLSASGSRRTRRSKLSSSSTPLSSSSSSSAEKSLPVLINAVCPGYVKTDMTFQKGRKTVEQGAELPVRLALDDIGGIGGEFWERGDVGVWDDGGEVGEIDGEGKESGVE